MNIAERSPDNDIKCFIFNHNRLNFSFSQDCFQGGENIGHLRKQENSTQITNNSMRRWNCDISFSRIVPGLVLNWNIHHLSPLWYFTALSDRAADIAAFPSRKAIISGSELN